MKLLLISYFFTMAVIFGYGYIYKADAHIKNYFCDTIKSSFAKHMTEGNEH